MEIRKGILWIFNIAILLIALRAQMGWILTVLFLLVVQVFAEYMLELIAKRNKNLSANNRGNILDRLKEELSRTQESLSASIKINEDSEARDEQKFPIEDLKSDIQRIKASIQELEPLEFCPAWHKNHKHYKKAQEQSEILQKALSWSKEDIINNYNNNPVVVWTSENNRNERSVEIRHVCTHWKQGYLLVPRGWTYYCNERVGKLKKAINLVADQELRNIIREMCESGPITKSNTAEQNIDNKLITSQRG